MRGIVLAGGSGTRLWPITKGVNKHLLHVYDKPMIHYPIGTLMAAGIKEILLIVNEVDLATFSRLLGSGSKYGVEFSYKVQNSPNGIAEAFIIGESFINNENSALILGDNIFHGSGLGRQLMDFRNPSGAHIFAYQVRNPSDYGVVEFDSTGIAISIEEKPIKPKSNYAIPGLYFYDRSVCDVAKSIRPSSRGELEISEVNAEYLRQGNLKVSVLPRGTAWLDTGNADSLHDASSYIKIIEERQGSKVSCLEEIAWRQKWISDQELEVSAMEFKNSSYGDSLLKLLELGIGHDD
jgi:glucose-1-phosphate thymidylyltransferase